MYGVFINIKTRPYNLNYLYQYKSSGRVCVIKLLCVYSWGFENGLNSQFVKKT